MSVPEHAIVVFDLRGFSSHREFLAKEKKASLSTELVKSLLNKAGVLLNKWRRQFDDEELPTLSHTGDGFLAIVRGYHSALTALLFASEFREYAWKEIRRHNTRVKEALPKSRPPVVDFGIGLNYGQVVKIHFRGVTDRRGEESETGFLATAINIASRVEGTTKKLPSRVICTKRLFRTARGLLHRRKRTLFSEKGAFRKLGLKKLRGLGNKTLYGCKPGLHAKFSMDLLSS